MARTLIQNISGSPITLPLPYSVVLPSGGGAVVADTVATVAAAVFVVPGMESMLALSEVASGNPTSGVPPTIGMGGQKLTGLGTPTSASDAATKDYVDTHGGGGGVTSVSAASPLASTGGTTPTISLSGTVATSNGGTGIAASGSSNGVVSLSAGASSLLPVVTATRTVGAEAADTIPVDFQLKNGAANYASMLTIWGQLVGGTLGTITLSAGAAGQVQPMADFATSGRFIMVTDANGVVNLQVTDTSAESVFLIYGPGPGTSSLVLGGFNQLTFA